MKNRLLLIFLLLTNFAFAQRNSISIGYGYGTTDQIISGLATALLLDLLMLNQQM